LSKGTPTGEVAVLVTNPALAREAHMALRALPHPVVQLNSIKDAFEFLAYRRPTLLVVDEALEGSSHRGFFVLEALARKSLLSPLTATLVLGQAVFRSHVWAAHDLAVDALLLKPITHRKLQTHAAKAMARKQALRPILEHLALEDTQATLRVIEAQLAHNPVYKVALQEHKANLLLCGDPTEAERFFRSEAAQVHGAPWCAAGLISALTAQGRLCEAKALADQQLDHHGEHLPLLDAAAQAFLAHNLPLRARTVLERACEHAALSLARQRKAVELALAFDEGREALTLASKVMAQFHESALLNINDRLRQFRAAALAPASHTLYTGIENLKQVRLGERELPSTELAIWELLAKETRARETQTPLSGRQSYVRQALAALALSDMKRQTAIACLEAAARTGLGDAGERLRQQLLAEPLTEFDQLRLRLLEPQLQQDDWGLAPKTAQPATKQSLWARLRTQLAGG